ncbi:MAG: hypothetical protein FWG97_05385 [Deltaproteobacteria bacterium]|nr:hypothetical protein [Deltaproteobacteria bacterium]
MKKTAPITEDTLDLIGLVLSAKGLDLELVPAKFADDQGLTSRDLSALRESQGQALLTWLEQIPDDQPADETESSGPAEPEESDNLAGDIRKAEDSVFVKRPLTTDECQSEMAELFTLESRRAAVEFELDGHKSRAKACQKEIETIDASTYRILRGLKANEVEEQVPALRVTNLTAGMISWFHADTGELLKERAIEPGEQLPLDLAGDAGAAADEPAADDAENNGEEAGPVDEPAEGAEFEEGGAA